MMKPHARQLQLQRLRNRKKRHLQKLRKQHQHRLREQQLSIFRHLPPATTTQQITT
jgi:hypothetical protein